MKIQIRADNRQMACRACNAPTEAQRERHCNVCLDSGRHPIIRLYQINPITLIGEPWLPVNERTW